MNILIVEDESRVAKLLEKHVKIIWEKSLKELSVLNSLEDARVFIDQNEIDLLFLDLNLRGEDGFQILEEFSSRSFHTIIVSAYRDRAVKAFEYGVLDFIPKPFDGSRLKKAYLRSIGEQSVPGPGMQKIPIKKKGRIILINVKDVQYIKSDGHYTRLHLYDQKIELCDKPLDRLQILLADGFFRTHRSYLVRTNDIQEILRHGGGKMEVLLKDGVILPLSRSKYKMLLEKISLE